MLSARELIIAPLVFSLSILAVTSNQYLRLQELVTAPENRSGESVEKDDQKNALRLKLLDNMPSFGYSNILSKWVYIEFLQYFGDDQQRQRTGYGLSPEFLKIVLKHDPRFLDAYLSLSVSTSLYAGMPKTAVNLMTTNLQLLSPKLPPKSYYVWSYKGIDELLFLGDHQAARQSFIKAATWAREYDDPEAQKVVFFSEKTANFLLRNPDSKFARIATWSMVLQNNMDGKTRQIAIGEIQNLGGKIVVNNLGLPIVIFPERD